VARVFVVNRAGHDFGPLRDTIPDADVIFLTEGNVNVFSMGRMIEDFKLKMLAAEEGDYILLSGYIVLNVVACSIMQARFGKVNLLLWQAREHKYLPREYTAEQLVGGPSGA
jgi:hypothetical protein